MDELPLQKHFLEILKNEVKEFNPPQKMALKNGLLDGKNLVIASPTASGKTMIAEIAMLNNFSNSSGKTLYLVPLKALASEKYHEFKEKYGRYMRIAMSVGDLDSGDEWLGNYDLIILTNEKADSLLRHQVSWMKSVNLIIADEIHLLNDPGRGPTLEIVLTRLRQTTKSQIIALSATIRNADEIATWLNANLVKSDYRPVKLNSGVFYPYTLAFDGNSYELEGRGDSETLLSEDTIKKGKQALIFVSTRRSAEATAEKISKKITSSKELSALAKDVENALSSPTKQCRRLAKIVAHGCAFHHAGLVAKQRKLIEDSFKSGAIKILAATPTLAFGVNLPAYRVIIRDMRRYDGNYGSSFIPILEVQQMMGRAGRPKYDKEGEAILIAKNEDEAQSLRERYIDGEPEPIYSKLSMDSVLRMHLLALIASDAIQSREDMEKFFSKTFFAFQYQDIGEVMYKLDIILEQLKNYNFIRIAESISPTRIGKRVAELYLDPESAYHIIKNLTAKDDMELTMMINECIEMHPLLRPKSGDCLEEELANYSLQQPDVWDLGYEDFMAAFKTSLMLRDWMAEYGEDKLLDNYGIAPGELYNKITNAEWMLYSAKELAILLNKNEIAKSLKKMQVRVKHGVREELLQLVKLRNIGRVRARMLYRKGIKTASDIKNTPEATIAKILGPKIAKQLKEVLEESLDEKMGRIKKRRHGSVV
ncbi:MAG: DEAD/DEAH box helicase [Candidatus Aenigmatarchaeota archaeon]